MTFIHFENIYYNLLKKIFTKNFTAICRTSHVYFIEKIMFPRTTKFSTISLKVQAAD